MASPNDNPALATEIAGVSLRNPVLLAAGTAGYVTEMAGAMDLSAIGGLVTKSITRQAREGNPTWRILETRGGMLNAIGLANVGMDDFQTKYAPAIAEAPCEVIGSVAGASIEDYVAVASMFDGIEAMRAVEVNVSCPNVKHGCSFGDDPALLCELLTAVRDALKATNLFVKLPPATQDIPDRDIVSLANAALDAGADALTLSNTLPAMAIDVKTRQPRLANVTGGLSGPALHAVTVRLVHLVYERTARVRGVPIIGAGGVTTWEDAAEFILAGASAVEMGTAIYADPRSAQRVVKGLSRWVADQGASSIGELVGAVDLSGGEDGR